MSSVTHPAQIIEVTNGTTRTLAAALDALTAAQGAETPQSHGATGDGVADDTTAIQAAINTGKDVFFPHGTYRLTNSLYLNTNGQILSGGAVLTMDNTLGKPCMWIGATDSSGTDNGVGVANVKIRGLRFLGSGARTVGSAGIAFMRATTTILDSVFSWGFAAGVDIRGWSLVNMLLNVDLRQNTNGILDRSSPTTNTSGIGGIDFQASIIVGGRIEQNVKEGVVITSSDVRFIGTEFEGNSSPGLGGTGLDSEVRIGPGPTEGSIDFDDCYFEILGGSTPAAIIQVDALTNRKIALRGGNYYGNDAANRYIIKTSSAGTTQAFSLIGCVCTGFKNYISGAITGNSTAVISPGWADASRDATADLSATAGATIYQIDRLLGVKTGLAWSSTVATGLNAIQLTNGARIKFGGGGTDYLYSDGARVKCDGNVVAFSWLTNGGVFGNFGTVATSLQGGVASTGTAIATKMTNTATLAAGDTITAFYSDNAATIKAKVMGDGSSWQAGVTFANLGTPPNGTVLFCTDATSPSNPATGGGTGAMCVRQNGIWKAL